MPAPARRTRLAQRYAQPQQLCRWSILLHTVMLADVGPVVEPPKHHIPRRSPLAQRDAQPQQPSPRAGMLKLHNRKRYYVVGASCSTPSCWLTSAARSNLPSTTYPAALRWPSAMPNPNSRRLEQGCSSYITVMLADVGRAVEAPKHHIPRRSPPGPARCPAPAAVASSSAQAT